MYKHNNNKTAVASQNMIACALFELMGTKPFADISVTEICDQAGVGRKTFYRNFETKEDVLDFRFEQLYKTFRENISAVSPDRKLYIYLEFIKEHTDKFILMYKNNLDEYTSEKFIGLMPQVMPVWSENDTVQQYISRYIVAGIKSVVRVWVERGFEETTDEIVALTEKLINHR